MLIHKGAKTLNTNRLILRKFKLSDADCMFKNWANDTEVCKYLTWNPHPDIEFTKNLLGTWIDRYENENAYNWVIELKENGEAIGDISIVNLDEKNFTCEIGYCLSSSFWSKGIMSESLNTVISYLFSEVGFNRITARHDIENIASGKVMEKCNMQYEGTLREALLNKYNKFSDLKLYSILKSDWEDNI